jgi:hypothetical protein
LRDIRGRAFIDVGGAALQNQSFVFWTTKGGPQLIDGRASYGFGVELNFLGLPLHWDFARLWTFKHTLSSFKTAFYIGPTF